MLLAADEVCLVTPFTPSAAVLLSNDGEVASVVGLTVLISTVELRNEMKLNQNGL